jgi:outer membrane protein assembly factor BamD (BamD/ComL family)
MDSSTTKAIFVVTGLVTATGIYRAEPTLDLAKFQVEEKQFWAAILTAERIIKHYPGTPYSESARELIDVLHAEHL